MIYINLNKRKLSRIKIWNLAHPDRYKYNERKQKAKKRVIEWNLTREWYIENIWDKQCSYCPEPSNGGIDRVNNKIGYEPSNCIPCCSWCNSIKMTHSIEEMYDHLRLMLALC